MPRPAVSLFRPSAPTSLLAGVIGILVVSSACSIQTGQPGDAIHRLTVAGRSSSAPWLAVSGSFVAVAWGAKPADGGSDVFVATSRDGGARFSAPVRVNTRLGEGRVGGEFPPRVALVPRTSGDPEVVVAWLSEVADVTDVRLARSRDGGRTFDAPRVLQQAGAPGSRGWHALALDSDGVAHALWLDHRGLVDPAPEPSQHAGHRMGASGDEAYDGVAMAQKSGLYYGSDAAGTTERELIEGVCYCCKTTLAAGPRGTLYAAWRQVYAGNIRDIAYLASRDGGRTFDQASRVSEDQWQINGCPDDGPAMTVDGAGTVHIVWPTVTGGEQPRGAIFYARSTDGRTFSERQLLPSLGTPKPAHPQVAVGPDGRLVVAWDELMGDKRVAVVATVAVEASGRATFGPPIRLEPDVPSSYPVIAVTPLGALAAWTSGPMGSSTIAVRRLGNLIGGATE